jgi:hypothetical protein
MREEACFQRFADVRLRPDDGPVSGSLQARAASIMVRDIAGCYW